MSLIYSKYIAEKRFNFMKIVKKNGLEFKVYENKIYVSTGEVYVYENGVLHGGNLRVPQANMDRALAFLLNLYDN